MVLRLLNCCHKNLIMYTVNILRKALEDKKKDSEAAGAKGDLT